MAIASGTRLGPYEIRALVGAGGMGEVYRGTDTRLNRNVAIKVLPPHLADAERRERFEREARAVSALNHPHICALYDVGSQDGVEYLVMEYLEGETLAARLAKGPLPRDIFLLFASQISQALAHAHHHGVLHRDLMPANVMILAGGVKLLDFGLAKVAPSAIVGNATDLPTVTRELTEKGTILGTLQYMAPEQLEGKVTDARSDIFSFGAVLYEMATGRKAFPGKSTASVIAAILEHDPAPVSEQGVPAGLDRVIRKCLEKNPDGRWQNAADIASVLEWSAENPQAAPTSDRPRSRMWIAGALVAALLGLTLATMLWRKPAQPARRMRFAVAAPEKSTLLAAAPAISPDGSLLAFLAATDGRRTIWIRAIDSLAARPLAGTDGASSMFWSPDGRFLAFVAGGKLQKLEIASGSVSTVCNASANLEGAWSQDDQILLTTALGGPIYRVQAAGGVPAPVTTWDSTRGDSKHGSPQWLDGQNFLYFIQTTQTVSTGIYAAASGPARPASGPILESRAAGRYAPPRDGHSGHLLFLRGETLMAQPFDPSTIKLASEPVQIAEPVGGVMVDYPGNPGFSISQNGVLAYHSISGPRSQVAWLDRAGTTIRNLAPSDVFSHVDLSQDGGQAAFERPDPKSGLAALWLVDVARGTSSRFSDGAFPSGVPMWSPRADRIVFNSVREGSRNLYWKSAGGGAEELLFKSGQSLVPSDWSPDGQFVLFYQGDERNRAWDIWAIPLSGDRKPFPVVQSPSNETHAQFSPDGRWIVYVSDESGTMEIYAQPFRGNPAASTGNRERVQITNGGGTQPRWRKDGRELYYFSPDNQVMAVSVEFKPKFEVRNPKPLFSVRGARGFGDGLYNYDVAPDGQHFLFNLSGDGAVSPITVVVNWDLDLR